MMTEEGTLCTKCIYKRPRGHLPRQLEMGTEETEDLDKFLYGDEYSDLPKEAAEQAATKAKEEEEGTKGAVDVDYEDEEEEEDYEIILDSSKVSSNAVANDINKRSLTSVSIDDGTGKTSSAGASGNESGDAAGANSSTTTAIPHFDPFAPGNLSGRQIYDHDLDSFEDKPWRKPGADLTDYFNFGFNEVTWRAYCIKQKALREEFGQQKKIGVYDSGSHTAGMSHSTHNTSHGTGNGMASSHNRPRAHPSSAPPPPPSVPLEDRDSRDHYYREQDRDRDRDYRSHDPRESHRNPASRYNHHQPQHQNRSSRSPSESPESGNRRVVSARRPHDNDSRSPP